MWPTGESQKAALSSGHSAGVASQAGKSHKATLFSGYSSGVASPTGESVCEGR